MEKVGIIFYKPMIPQIGAQIGHTEIVKLVLLVANDKSPKGLKGQTPLHAAAKSGHIEVVKTFLENIEDANPKDTEEWTPFHFAAFNGHSEIVQIIINMDLEIRSA